MPKNSNIQTRWVNFPSAVEIAGRSNMVTKGEISIIEKIFLICQTPQIFRGAVFDQLP